MVGVLATFQITQYQAVPWRPVHLTNVYKLPIADALVHAAVALLSIFVVREIVIGVQEAVRGLRLLRLGSCLLSPPAAEEEDQTTGKHESVTAAGLCWGMVLTSL